ncbi:Efflux pump vrtL [Drechslerella dactyloides]|uniref:Efflux pump vrtL n=1 Tax=Drechslerella dactyloides TaxID=74499 RepID=A0AAD6J4F6_DREDA|nr:Efflux pump vrtL [Drechslerella dactyloides]
MSSEDRRPPTRQDRSRRNTNNSDFDERPRLGSELQASLSAQFIDDQSVYQQQPSHSQYDSTSSSEADLQDLPAVEIDSISGRLSDIDIDLEKQDGEIIVGIESEELKGALDFDRDQKLKLSKTKTDPNLVTWDGPDDPENPLNWSIRKKWTATVVISAFTFLSPVSSSMVAPAISSVAKDLNIQGTVAPQLTMTVFVLAYAVTTLFTGPLSEVFGRVPVIQISNLFYLVFNTACGASKTETQMIVFRFLAGAGGAAPLALGGGVLSDVWPAEQRGKGISMYSLAPLLGPAIGPIAGGWIVQSGLGWRWIFYIMSMIDAVIQIAGTFLLQETYAPKLLQAKARRLRKETGNMQLHTPYEADEKRRFSKVLRTALVRPLKLLGTQPIIQFMAAYNVFLYGLLYIVLSTFPPLWEIRYGQSVGIGSLNYISLGLGFFLGTQICAPINDKIYVTLKRRNNGVGLPEFRVPLMPIGVFLVPLGLLAYGWSAQAKTHWIVPNIGAMVLAGGTIMGFQCIQTYIIDTYTRYAASAIASITVLRSIAGFGFPLFAPAMYKQLDYGWGNTTLALAGIVIGWPGPFILWKWGAKLRAKSQFAAS